MIVVAIVMIFSSGLTFASLGMPLFAMSNDFRWSATAVGGGYTILVLAACIASLTPMLLIPRIGGRWTIVGGCAILATACAIASTTNGLATIYGAIAVAGIGYSLTANAPAIYLIAGWSGDRAPRMIGLYLMIASLGGAIAPPIAQALISLHGGWRLYWIEMLAVALVLAGLCAWALREPPATPEAPAQEAQPAQVWTYGRIVRSPRFIILALAMVATQGCVITVSAVAPGHLVTLGWSADFAARMLGLQGLVGTVATGVSGFLTKRVAPRWMLVAGLVVQAIGMMLLASPAGNGSLYGFALSFGIGWSVTCLAVTILLVEYFGDLGGTTALATIWTLAGAAAAGPWAAGLVADAGGSFRPALIALGLLLLPIALATPFLTPSQR
jgi:MFS family permease